MAKGAMPPARDATELCVVLQHLAEVSAATIKKEYGFFRRGGPELLRVLDQL